VRDAFRALGHDAWSCDLEPCEGDPQWHFQEDIFTVLDDTHGEWDLGIFHPDCTYLTNAGVRWLHKAPAKPKPGNKYGWARRDAMRRAAHFFNKMKDAAIPRIAVENPIPHKYARELIGRYDQTIQPYQFGQPYTKRTCLWLKGLPPLMPTKVLPPPYIAEVHLAPPGPERWKARSRTYQGIADAMAHQWGGLEIGTSQ
jgi:hypothetical protein